MSVGTDRDESSRSRRGVYGISVASELSGFGMQALRLYEQHGLVTPARTEGGTRRYSDDDLLRLERIAELIEPGQIWSVFAGSSIWSPAPVNSNATTAV